MWQFNMCEYHVCVLCSTSGLQCVRWAWCRVGANRTHGCVNINTVEVLPQGHAYEHILATLGEVQALGWEGWCCTVHVYRRTRPTMGGGTTWEKEAWWFLSSLLLVLHGILDSLHTPWHVVCCTYYTVDYTTQV